MFSPDPQWQPAFCTALEGDVDTSDGDLCIKIANLAFGTQPTVMQLDKWQEWVIRMALARNATTGERLFRQFMVSLGRQNGKSTLATALVLWGMLTRGDANVVGIASNTEQANIVYRRVLNIVLNSASLKKRFKRLTETRALATHTGGLYKVLPSKGSALQGHTVSLAIADEVHLMNSEVYNAIVIGAGQVPDSLVFSITTAGDEESGLLLDLYDKLRSGMDGFGGVIWEADEGAQVNDLTQLRKANPALAEGRMKESQILQEVAMLPEPEARRYRLNRFIATENGWLPHNAWNGLPRMDADDMPYNPVLVVDRTPDWSAATIAIAWKQDDLLYTDIVLSLVKPDLHRLLNSVLEVAGTIPHQFIALDGMTLGELAEGLKTRGLRTVRLARKDHIQAASVAYQKITAGMVVHPHHQMLEWQFARVITKNVGDAYRLTRATTTTEIDAATATVLSIFLADVSEEVSVQVF